MSVPLLARLYDYHRWANRRLFVVAEGLGDVVDREIGAQFSAPTLKGMLAHIFAADEIWLARFQGVSPARLATGADFPTMADLRRRWDAVESAQRAFVEKLEPGDLDRIVEYRNTAGKASRPPLGPLLLHVANHATHHRSEVATMLTMVKGSPPATDLVLHELIVTGQAAP